MFTEIESDDEYVVASNKHYIILSCLSTHAPIECISPAIYAKILGYFLETSLGEIERENFLVILILLHLAFCRNMHEPGELASVCSLRNLKIVSSFASQNYQGVHK